MPRRRTQATTIMQQQQHHHHQQQIHRHLWKKTRYIISNCIDKHRQTAEACKTRRVCRCPRDQKQSRPQKDTEILASSAGRLVHRTFPSDPLPFWLTRSEAQQCLSASLENLRLIPVQWSSQARERGQSDCQDFVGLGSLSSTQCSVCRGRALGALVWGGDGWEGWVSHSIVASFGFFANDLMSGENSF